MSGAIKNGTCFVCLACLFCIFAVYKIFVRMNIVIDEKIPFLREALEAMGHSVVALPGVRIAAADVSAADALFVRTRTMCNAALLDGSKVRFIGTATIGYDHIDAAYCECNGIEWASAAGCNAGAVLQYVQSVIYSWAKERECQLQGLSLGIVGVGEIGSRVAAWARSEGMRLLLNDPPRQAKEGSGNFVSLADIARECDIITFHPTLSRGGDFPSYHLANEAFLSSLEKCRLLINASRGPVVDNLALLDALDDSSLFDTVLDVWENEPEILLPLLNKVYIATPHIAGYSAEGKLNATRLVLEAFAVFSGYDGVLPLPALPVPEPQVIAAPTYADALLQIYTPDVDSKRLKRSPETFEEQRNNYALRREPSAYKMTIEM